MIGWVPNSIIFGNRKKFPFFYRELYKHDWKLRRGRNDSSISTFLHGFLIRLPIVSLVKMLLRRRRRTTQKSNWTFKDKFHIFVCPCIIFYLLIEKLNKVPFSPLFWCMVWTAIQQCLEAILPRSHEFVRLQKIRKQRDRIGVLYIHWNLDLEPGNSLGIILIPLKKDRDSLNCFKHLTQLGSTYSSSYQWMLEIKSIT